MIYEFKQPKQMGVYVNRSCLKMQRIQESIQSDVLCNFQLFNSNWTACCFTKVDGVIIGNDGYVYEGFGWNETDGKLTFDTSNNHAKYANFVGCLTVVKDGVYPNYTYPKAIAGKRGRTALGTKEDGTIVLLCVPDSQGLTIPELAVKMINQGCKYAINFDGGGSCQCITPVGTLSSTRIVHTLFWAKLGGSMKIYLSPSSQIENLYSAGGTNEQAQCNRIAEAARQALERCGFLVKKAPEGQGYVANVNESNQWGADYHVPIHTNAGGGHGPIIFVYDMTEPRKTVAQSVYNAVNAIVPTPSTYGVQQRRNLYEITHTVGKCVYIESAFHDNASEAAWIVGNTTALGEAICKGFCAGLSVPYVAPEGNMLTWAQSHGFTTDGADASQPVTKQDLWRAAYLLNGGE